MSKKDDLRIPDYLGHIVEAIERIHRYVEDMSEVDFLDDEKTQDAMVRNFYHSHALALIILHKCFQDTVILAGMPESSHMEVKVRCYPVPLNNGEIRKLR